MSDIVQWIVRKLETERYAESPEHGDLENARRAGWNARSESLAAEIRVAVGLLELAASDVDGGT